MVVKAEARAVKFVQKYKTLCFIAYRSKI